MKHGTVDFIRLRREVLILPVDVEELLQSFWTEPEIFKLLKKWADLKDKDMYSTFNMGVGLTFVVKEEDRDKVTNFFKNSDLKLYELGKVVTGEDKIELSF